MKVFTVTVQVKKNSSLGADAGFSNTTGSYNTYLGYFSGYNNSTGSRNIFLDMRLDTMLTIKTLPINL